MKRFFEIFGLVALGMIAGAMLHRCQNPWEEPRGYGTASPYGKSADGVEVVAYFDTLPYSSPIPIGERAVGNVTASLKRSLPAEPRAETASRGIDKSGAFEWDSSARIGKSEAFEQDGSAPDAPDFCAREFKAGLVSDDSVAVEIPIIQREYEGEGYHAWVSGYEPRLDSISIFAKREVVTVREPPNRPKRWGIGVFAGYGVTPHGWQPCAGISINYNLWNF